MESKRLFVGIPVADGLKEHIRVAQHQLLDAGDVELSRTENLHFTAKFLGDVPEDKIYFIRQQLSEVARQHKPFQINIAGVGAFPNMSDIRVVWLGVADGEELMKTLISDVQQRLEVVHPEDFKDIQVHLTIARPGASASITTLQSLLGQQVGITIGMMTVDRLVLYASKKVDGVRSFSVLKYFNLKEVNTNEKMSV